MPPTPTAEVFRLRALELREWQDEFLALARTSPATEQKAAWLRCAELSDEAATALEALIVVLVPNA
jgi:hypothetical protein